MPAVGKTRSEHHADGRALARAVGAEEAEQVALVDLQPEVVDGHQPTGVPLRQPVRADDDGAQSMSCADDVLGHAVELGER